MVYSKNKHFLVVILFLHIILHFNLNAKAEAISTQTPWIRAGYWLTVSLYPAQDIDATLFTHIFYGFAGINSTTFHLSIPASDQQSIASFSSIVRRRNPAVKTVLSVGDSRISPTFMDMIKNGSSRKAFVESSIEIATRYGFDGLNVFDFVPNNTVDAGNMGALLREWRAEIESHYRRTNKRLILSMCVYYLPLIYPVNSMQTNLDWVNILTFDYYTPLKDKFAHPHAALYDPYNPNKTTDFGIKQWIKSGLSPDKILLGLPYHGWMWTLVNPKDNRIGSPASGPAYSPDGSVGYRYLMAYVPGYKAKVVYNSSYVENYCSFGSFWVAFDDVNAIREKVLYAKQKGLRGYFVFRIGNDDNWKLSMAAAQIKGKIEYDTKKSLLMKVLLPLGCLGCMIILAYFFRTTLLHYIRMLTKDVQSFGNDSPDLNVFKFVDISAATNNFSCYNILGEGGYGPVYKGKLRKGQEIAVKRLSKASSQGFEEFKNEVMLTARLQHVNLVKVIGFCVEREEKMLIYEYLDNKSLDSYIFDPLKGLELDWEKRCKIIEGIIQGLVYLQEYSRLTIIHRDLKASNILLDKEFNPKISDFGMARIFHKDRSEANTSRIVGTYGYVPPEYVKKGVYSMKYDVYSFGVLLLQIISGKRNDCFYGPDESLNLLEYAYELWMDARGMEFIDPTLDDSNSRIKLMHCMLIGLLCVQENHKDRPSMLEVLSMVKHEIEASTVPKRPAFSVKPNGPDADELSSCSCSHTQYMQVHSDHSHIDSTISELEPR